MQCKRESSIQLDQHLKFREKKKNIFAEQLYKTPNMYLI